MSISIKEYFALAGSRFSKEEARAIGPLLHELAIEGRSSSADVVEAARSSNSPIRRFFEWDDVRAGHLYRLSQADEMIGSIRVRYTADNREYATRAFRVIVAP